MGSSHFYVDPQDRFASHNDTFRAAPLDRVFDATLDQHNKQRWFNDPSKISITPFAGLACPDVDKWIRTYLG